MVSCPRKRLPRTFASWPDYYLNRIFKSSFDTIVFHGAADCAATLAWAFRGLDGCCLRYCNVSLHYRNLNKTNWSLCFFCPAFASVWLVP